MPDVVFSAGQCLLGKPMTAAGLSCVGHCLSPATSRALSLTSGRLSVASWRRPFHIEITRSSVRASDLDVQSRPQVWGGPTNRFSERALLPSPSLPGSALSSDALPGGGGWPLWTPRLSRSSPSSRAVSRLPCVRALPRPSVCSVCSAFSSFPCPHPGPHPRSVCPLVEFTSPVHQVYS